MGEPESYGEERKTPAPARNQTPVIQSVALSLY